MFIGVLKKTSLTEVLNSIKMSKFEISVRFYDFLSLSEIYLYALYMYISFVIYFNGRTPFFHLFKKMRVLRKCN